MLLTTRGLPCLYYGTEILMPGKDGNGDAYYRFDFPGGWASDSINKFEKSGRTALEQEAFSYVQTLNRLRNQNPLFDNGKFTQYSCIKDVYSSTWTLNEHPGLINLYSASSEEQVLNWSRYATATQAYKRWRNIHTGESGFIEGSITLSPQETLSLELLP